MEPLIPTTSFCLWPDLVDAYCFGTRHGSWALDETPSKAEQRNPGILGKLSQLGTQYGLSKIYVPIPTRFNAEIAHSGDFRPWYDSVLRGPFADGVRLIERGTAFGVASSDCPTVILYDPYHGDIVAAHAGRDSLIDRAHLEGRSDQRRYASVIDAMIAAIGRNHTSHCRAFVACGIHPNNFPHRITDGVHGEKNQHINRHVIERWGAACVQGGVREGRLWLSEIIRRQFAAHGLDAARIGTDGIDTYDDRSLLHHPHWHSHRRDRDYNAQAVVPGRNFVLVHRR